MNGSLKFKWGLGRPGERAVAGTAGTRGERGAPLYPKSARVPPWAQQVWSGAAQQRHPASRRRRARLCPLKAPCQRACAPGRAHPVPPARVAGAPWAWSPSSKPVRPPQGRRTGVHSATEGFEVEHCPPLVLFLKCPAVSCCQSPVYQPVHSQCLRLFFHLRKVAYNLCPAFSPGLFCGDT